jgi:SsrA-binding protein
MRPTGTKVVATNRQARRNYSILDTIEAGLVLRGSEVKSLRDAKVQITDAYARIDGGEIWLHALHIAPYGFAQDHSGHEPDRKRKLLLHSHEIERLRSRVDPEQLSLLPLAKGRKTYDKRQALAERDAAMDVRRALARGDRDD